MSEYQFREFYIPQRMMDSLLLYLEHGVEPGSFLTAVLENDLRRAVENADAENQRNLPAYIAYLYNEAPAGSWGSTINVSAWIDKHAAARSA